MVVASALNVTITALPTIFAVIQNTLWHFTLGHHVEATDGPEAVQFDVLEDIAIGHQLDLGDVQLDFPDGCPAMVLTDDLPAFLKPIFLAHVGLFVARHALTMGTAGADDLIHQRIMDDDPLDRPVDLGSVAAA